MTSNEPEPVRTAKDIAEALGRSPNEKGVGKLAAALAQPSASLTIADKLDIDIAVDAYGRSREVLYATVELICSRRMRDQLKSDHAAEQRRLDAIFAERTAPLEFRPDGSPCDSLPIVSIGPFGIGGEGQREVKP